MEPKRPRGRPKGSGALPEEQKAVRPTFTCPPELWRQARALIPRGELSRLLQRALEREVRRLEKAARDLPPPG